MLTTLKTQSVTKWTWSGAGFVRESPGEKQIDALNRRQVYKRARYYDPSTGEFVSRDPLEYVDGMSLYRAYMELSLSDPSGQTVGPPAAVIIAAAVIGAAAVCLGPYYIYARANFKGKTDKWNHCWVSCSGARTCSAVIAQLGGLAKEIRDEAIKHYCTLNPGSIFCKGGPGGGFDINDLAANQQCINWETYIGLGVISMCFRETCADCCTRKGL